MEASDSRVEALREVRDLQQRRQRANRRAPLWYFASILTHLLVFGLIVWFTPLREVVKEAVAKKPSRPVQSVQQVQRMSQLIEQAQQSRVRTDALAVQSVHQQLELIRRNLASNYVEYAHAATSNAVPEIENLFKKAIAQSEATAKQMREQLRPLSQQARGTALQNPEQPNSTVESYLAQQQSAMNLQNEVTKTLEVALNKAQLVAMTNSAQRLQESAQKQNEAFDAQQAVKSELEKARQDALIAHVRQRQLRDIRAWKNNLTNQVAQAHRYLAHLETRKVELRASIATDEGRKQAAEVMLERLKNEQSKQTNRAELDANKRDQNRAQESIKRIENAQAHRAREVENIDKNLTNLQERIARLHQEVRRINLREETHITEMRLAQERAERAKNRLTHLQEQAIRKQQEVVQHLQSNLRELKKDTPRAELLTQQLLTHTPLQQQDIRTATAPELYTDARQEEVRIVEIYRDVRALERAMLSGMSIEHARKMTDIATPNRRVIDTSILKQDIRTVARLDAYKETLGEVVRETASIRAAVEALLTTANERQQAQHEGFSVAFIHERAAQLRSAQAAAAEDEGQVAKDLTRVESQQPPAPEAPPVTEQKVEQKLPAITTAQELPGQRFGRTISPSGWGGQWLAINSWYVIGPFPNPQRVNIDRKFPPETVLDLDATYVGKDNRMLRWGFHQSPRARIVPKNVEPYGIWYAYTEVRCETDCDLWVAIGSDDKSKIWLNDQLIWESVPWHKEWRINEGYRKVHFKAGRNRILYRIENGHNTMAWSLLLATAPAQK